MLRKRKVVGCAHPQRRRGVVALQVAFLITAIAGFAALTIDVGAMFTAKSELQRTADAAALAAASRLAAYDEGDPMLLARAEAEIYTQQNRVFTKVNMTLEASDVEFGRAMLDPTTGGYNFQPSTMFPDAVRVRVRMEEGSVNGALALTFARIFGHDSADITAEAVAMMVPRDIALVADLSGSHTDDSELRNYQLTDINLHEVWDNFPGGIDDGTDHWAGDEFEVDESGFSSQMAGPAWGLMRQLGWGTMNLNSSYEPASDDGLLHLPRYEDWDNGFLENALVAQGYSTTEVNAIMADTYDSNGAWDERVAVALGLARWYSGHSGGLWEQQGVPADQTGNGNNWVGASELTWVESFGNRSLEDSRLIWRDYINNYMRLTNSQMAMANSAFRYRFGVKTFMNYLLERRPTNAATPELANTAHQPMQAVKDAVSHMSSVLLDLETVDQLSLEVYSSTGRHEIDLTDNYATVANRLDVMQGGHYSSWTNMGAGIQRAIEELSSDRARPTSRKVMILLTDGVANVNAAGQTGDYMGGRDYARVKAAQAVDQGIRIFCVSVGAGADRALMDEIAAMGSGEHFHAEGSISSYSTELEQIFQTLGGTRPVELIR